MAIVCIFILNQIQGGCKLVGQKGWFIMRSSTAKHESTHDYEIVKHIKFVFFLKTLKIAALRYSLNNSFHKNSGARRI